MRVAVARAKRFFIVFLDSENRDQGSGFRDQKIGPTEWII
jgi:hypothetical protein